MNRTSFTLTLVLLLVIGCAFVDDLSVAGQQPNRLIVDNRTRGLADIQAYRYNGQGWTWQHVMTLNPGTWQPVPYVEQGEQFRAWLRTIRQFRYHNVNLQYDQGYGGLQDIWQVYE